MLSLRELLELRVAFPAGFSDDGESVLLLSNRAGTMQLYRVPRYGGELVQLTDFDEPVAGQYVPDAGGRILLSIDEGGNERGQLHLLEPGLEPQPFAVDPESIHRSACTSFDGRLVGYVSNKRNGVDFDVYVQPLVGEARLLAELGGWCDTVGFSPDGRWLAVSKLTDRSGDNDLYLVGVEDGEVVHISPHDDEAAFERPVWRADSRSFLFATSTGRDTTAIARYDLEAGRFDYVLEDDWDLAAYGDRSGRHLLVEANEDGYSRVELRDPETLELRARVPLPGRGVAQPFVFSRDGRFLAYHFDITAEPGDVWLYDTESGETARLTRSADEESARVDAGTAAAPLRLVRRRVDPGLPLQPRPSRSGARDRQHPRRSGGPGPADLECSERVLGLARVRGSGAERARLHRIRQAVRASRRPSISASTRCATSRRSTTGSQPAKR